MNTQKRVGIVLALVAAVVIGNWVKEELYPSPPDRPVLRFLAKVAKWGMWLLVFAEPEQPAPTYNAVDENHIDHMRSL